MTSSSTKSDFDRFYAGVPQEQREQLRRFRATHPQKQLAVGSRRWRYTSSGRRGAGEECLVFLAGGLQVAEPFFRLILALEDEYRVIAPTYPPVRSIEEWVEGLRAILDQEGVSRADLVGTSLGGMLAQCFVRRYPQRVSKLVLGDTTVPDPSYGRKLKLVSRVVTLLPMPLLKLLALRSFSGGLSAVPESDRAFWQAYFREYTAHRWTRARINTQYNCITDFAFNYTFKPDDLGDWSGKILIIESQDDQAINPALQAALRAAYPQAQVYTFSGGGHVLVITRQHEYLSVLRDFLREGQPGRQPEESQDPRVAAGTGARAGARPEEQAVR